MQYPRMIYKTREDHIIVQNEEEHKAAVGYKLHWEDKEPAPVKPVEKVVEKPIEKVVEKPVVKKKRVIRKKK